MPIRLLLTACAMIAVARPTRSEIQGNGDRELLRLVAETYRDNLERIDTWSGTATIRSHVAEDTGYSRVLDAAAGFVLDRNREAVRWRWDARSKVETYPDHEGPVVVAPNSRSGMLADGRYYDLSPGGEDASGRPVEMLVIWPQERYTRTGTAKKFHPLEYMTTSGYPTWFETLMAYHKTWDQYKDIPIVLSLNRAGDIVTLTNKRTSADGYREVRWEFDLSKGGNPVLQYTYVRQWDLEIVEERTYMECEGIWLPETYERHYRDGGRGDNWQRSARTHTETVRFTTNIVNKPIDPNEFALDALGVAPGTRVTDRVVGLVYHYRTDPTGHDLDALPIDPVGGRVGPNEPADEGGQAQASEVATDEQGRTAEYASPAENSTVEMPAANVITEPKPGRPWVPICAVGGFALCAFGLWRIARRRRSA